MKLFLKISAYCLIIIFTALLGVSLYTIILVKDVHLDEAKLSAKTINYEFYDDNEQILQTSNLKNQNNNVKIEDLNKHTINAFIAIEDRKFYTHKGFDVKRMVGATLNNVKSLKLKEGASTISQQLIKNTHLNNKKTIKRKLYELKITTELEKKYTKEQILEKYLNTIYFGSGAYGINNASLLYFNKSAKDLTLNESCILAGLIKSPANYSPITNYENSIKRKNVVLKCMLDCNFISKSEYNECLNKSVSVNKNKIKNYYDDYINATLLEYENLNINPYNYNTIKIYTSLNLKQQQSISDINIQNMPNANRRQIIINSKNGDIIAFYGNNSNYKRSPASTVKPWLVYAPAINENFVKESTILKDEKKNFGGYSPKNYGDKYYGKVTVKTALIKSLNVTAVDLLNSFGIEKSIKYANKMNLNVNNKDLSIALGAIEGGMTLQEICDAYTTFSNKGNYVKSHFIKKIVCDNKTLYKNNNDSKQVFKEETAYIINDALKESTKTGTSSKLKGFDFDLCAKTGTNGKINGNLDAYSIAYTSNHVLGTWLGFDDNTLMPNTITGGNYPTIFQREALKNLYANSKPNSFDVPPNLIKEYIDEAYLLENEKEIVSNETSGKAYYYIKGTQPTENKALNNNLEIIDANITLNNNVVSINLDVKNATDLKIDRIFNNAVTNVYSGKYIDYFIDKIYNFGKYEYVVTVKYNNQTKTIKLPNVIYQKSSLSTINSDDWLRD